MLVYLFKLQQALHHRSHHVATTSASCACCTYVAVQLLLCVCACMCVFVHVCMCVCAILTNQCACVLCFGVSHVHHMHDVDY